MRSWQDRPPRDNLSREAALAVFHVLAPHLRPDHVERILGALELYLANAIRVATDQRGGQRDPASGIAAPSNIQYTHPARTAEEAIRDQRMVAGGRNIPAPTPQQLANPNDTRDYADPARGLERGAPPPKKIVVPGWV